MNTTDNQPHADALARDLPVAVIGLGTMGHGIAQAFAVGGYTVRAIDERPDSADSALTRITSNLEQLTTVGLLNAEQIPDVLGRITVCDTLEETVTGTGLVTEAAWENLDVKQELLRQIEPLVDEHTILASNSSSFPISETARDLAHPQRAVVTHWFNPPHVIPVVEVVGGVRIDKELTGFLVNRVQVAMFREVFDLLDRGVATASEIDRAIRGSMGLRLAALGPLAIMDYAGWDISSATFTNLVPDMRGDTEIPESIRRMVEDGNLGAKSGQGIYSYPPETLDDTIAQRDADYLALVKLLHSTEDPA